MRASPEQRNNPFIRCQRKARPSHVLNQSVDGNIAANAERNREQQRQRHPWSSDEMSRRISDVDEDSRQIYSSVQLESHWATVMFCSSLPERPDIERSVPRSVRSDADTYRE